MHVDGVEETRAALVAELGGADGPLVRVAEGNPCRSGFRTEPFRD